MADPDWERCLTPVLHKAIPLLTNLVGGLLLERLFAQGIIMQHHYDEILQLKTTAIKADVARQIFQILTRTAAPNFDRFCTILDEIEGGSHLHRLLKGRERGDTLNKPNGPESYKAAEEEQKQKYIVDPMRFTEDRLEEISSVWALNIRKLYHHRKERLCHLPYIRQELDARREELIDSFSKQNVLLIGPSGAGKSSIINSFNYVVSLAADKDAQLDEIAEVGGNLGKVKTRRLLHYNATVGGMYKALLQSPNDEHRKKAQVGPTLIDTPGLPDRRDLAYLLRALILGDIPPKSDLDLYMSFRADSYENFKGFVESVSEKKVEAKAACVVLLVMEKQSSMDMYEGPSNLVAAINTAVRDADTIDEYFGTYKQRGIKKALSQIFRCMPTCEIVLLDVRVFVVLTKPDKIADVHEELKDRSSYHELCNCLNISSHRIFEISNFSFDDEDAARQMQSCLEKQIKIVAAFREILAVKPK